MKKIILIISLLFPLLAWASNDVGKINQLIKQAQEATAKGDFKTATHAYVELVDSLGYNHADVCLNLANAYLLSNDTLNALNRLQGLLSNDDKMIQSIANQQVGVIATNKHQLEPALTFFKNALLANPHNDDARYNYELVKKMIEQQDKDQQQNQEQQDKDQQQNQEQQNKDQQQNQEQQDKDQQQNQEQQNKDQQQNQEQQNKDQQQNQEQQDKDQQQNQEQQDKDQQQNQEQQNKDQQQNQEQQDKDQQQNQEQQNKDQQQDQEQQNKDQQQDQEQQNKDQQQNQEQQNKDQQQNQEQQGEKEKQEQQTAGNKEKKGEENPENKKQQAQPIPSVAEKLKEMNLSEQKARMILEAMKNSEIQYIQQKQKKPTKRVDRSKPNY